MTEYEKEPKRRYLIAEGTPVLVRVAETCSRDPEIDLVEVHGREDDPTVLVIETNAKRAAELAQEFGDVVLEVAAELNL